MVAHLQWSLYYFHGKGKHGPDAWRDMEVYEWIHRYYLQLCSSAS